VFFVGPQYWLASSRRQNRFLIAVFLQTSVLVVGSIEAKRQQSRRHQSHRMAESLKLARPMVRRGASFDADQLGWQFLEERQDRPPLQLTADDHLASGINPVDLEDRLRDIETDCRDSLHG
jgi:hypothetical protein